MKSTNLQLANRGFLAKGLENLYLDKNYDQCIDLLQSKQAQERTLGARLLGIKQETSALDYLLKSLCSEKKLYPKIEICNALVLFDTRAIDPLIGLLGKIGKNQHQEIPVSKFKKDNYPLPRDITGRTLVRIGEKAVPQLMKVLIDKDLVKISETIDVLGFINFYARQNQPVYDALLNCFNLHSDKDLIKWKIIRAFSGFSESLPFLTALRSKEKNSLLVQEIDRSIYLINKRIKI